MEKKRSWDDDKIGFLGMGAMGFPIAYGLYKKGYKLILPTYRSFVKRGFSPLVPDEETKSKCLKEMLQDSAQGAQNQKELLTNSKLLILSLPTSREVEAVMEGENGILANMQTGSTVIDLTSADPESTRKYAELLSAKGIELLDAPVSGGTIGATNQSLSVMVGGKKEVFQECREIFDTLGNPEKVFYMGPSGAGDTIKCANNFLSAACFAATTEALMTCAKAGIEPDLATQLINVSGGSSSSTAHKFPHLIFPGKDMGMIVKLMLKDIALFLAEAKKNNVPTFVGETVYQLWNLPVAEGDGDKDLKEFVVMYEKWCKTKLCGIKQVEK